MKYYSMYEKLENRNNIVYDPQTDCLYWLFQLSEQLVAQGVELAVREMFTKQEIDQCVYDRYGYLPGDYNIWDPCTIF